jgi:hypothetical protein
MIKRRKMNTIVNITGITLKCLGASDESAIRKAKRRKYDLLYYLKNKEKLCKKSRLYKSKNKEKYALQRKIRRHTDIKYRLLINCRKRLNKAMNKNIKSNTTIKLLGCNSKELWIHLESTFKPGMTRKNYGKWEIDHIRPCASFDLSKPEEQIKCFHYTNLQALWSHENLSKGAKITTIN